MPQVSASYLEAHTGSEGSKLAEEGAIRPAAPPDDRSEAARSRAADPVPAGTRRHRGLSYVPRDAAGDSTRDVIQSRQMLVLARLKAVICCRMLALAGDCAANKTSAVPQNFLQVPRVVGRYAEMKSDCGVL